MRKHVVGFTDVVIAMRRIPDDRLLVAVAKWVADREAEVAAKATTILPDSYAGPIGVFPGSRFAG